jgi:hypothetical protein
MASQNSLKSPGGITRVGSLITCSEGCVGPGLSLAWTAWLRLRCNTRPIKGGELAVCSSHSSENYLLEHG